MTLLSPAVVEDFKEKIIIDIFEGEYHCLA